MKLTRRQWAGFFMLLSQLFFIVALSFNFQKDLISDLGLIYFGWILVIISFLVFVLGGKK